MGFAERLDPILNRSEPYVYVSDVFSGHFVQGLSAASFSQGVCANEHDVSYRTFEEEINEGVLLLLLLLLLTPFMRFVCKE